MTTIAELNVVIATFAEARRMSQEITAEEMPIPAESKDELDTRIAFINAVEYRTRKDSRYGSRNRKSKNPRLRFCGTERGHFSMQASVKKLDGAEPLVCCSKWVPCPIKGGYRRSCFMGDNSSLWIERKSQRGGKPV